MTPEITTPPSAASRPAGEARAPNGTQMMPLVGLMVRPFPKPGPTLRAAMQQLQHAVVEPPADEELDLLAQMPRPWEPASCTGQMRSELWAWLDLVAMWVGEQHLWVGLDELEGLLECDEEGSRRDHRPSEGLGHERRELFALVGRERHEHGISLTAAPPPRQLPVHRREQPAPSIHGRLGIQRGGGRRDRVALELRFLQLHRRLEDRACYR